MLFSCVNKCIIVIMNYQGSSRHLFRNAKSALLASIEIYNKPSFLYREETFVILLLNSWELLLKAIISKNRGSIYYRKKRNEPYRTMSMTDAFTKAEKFFPKKIPTLPLRANLSLLSTYRDNAVHFYNEKNFGILIYSLAQTNIINFKDLLLEIFGKNLAHDISWQLIPLGIEPPIDPVKYISQGSKNTTAKGSAVRQFMNTLVASLEEVEKAGDDTARLMTIFNVSVQSVKKIEKADFVAGVDGVRGATGGPLIITKIQDPNITHPWRQKNIVQKIGSLNGEKFTPYTFQAICFKFKLKEDPRYCWRSNEGDLTRYSNEIILKIKSLKKQEVAGSLESYRSRSNS